ncbi:hypothetical protein M501DRAFT_1002359 [Patellaria atrata CBS 101060]|uniref:Uncharacterized protein n=1 Tax=Patellaria atrata CBS 101060 TaxID=1346257 RepID=A0A9P4VTZ1_9PEZI|nr:hypothetical protein M501DRAFT_1002359 [Patellaria atrata CBS 101060]
MGSDPIIKAPNALDTMGPEGHDMAHMMHGGQFLQNLPLKILEKILTSVLIIERPITWNYFVTLILKTARYKWALASCRSIREVAIKLIYAKNTFRMQLGIPDGFFESDTWLLGCKLLEYKKAPYLRPIPPPVHVRPSIRNIELLVYVNALDDILNISGTYPSGFGRLESLTILLVPDYACLMDEDKSKPWDWETTGPKIQHAFFRLRFNAEKFTVKLWSEGPAANKEIVTFPEDLIAQLESGVILSKPEMDSRKRKRESNSEFSDNDSENDDGDSDDGDDEDGDERCRYCHCRDCLKKIAIKAAIPAINIYLSERANSAARKVLTVQPPSKKLKVRR